jgi:hypothetical protein
VAERPSFEGEALALEVSVEGERAADVELAHELEADVIHERAAAAQMGQVRRDRSAVHPLVHVLRSEQWYDSFEQTANDLATEPAVRQRRGLHDDVRMRRSGVRARRSGEPNRYRAAVSGA